MKQALFVAGPSLTTKLVVFTAISLILMTVDHRFHHLQAVRSGLSVLVYPVQYVVDLPFRIGEWTDELFSSRDQLLARNQTLEEESLTLHAHLQRMEALERENNRLRHLLDASTTLEQRVSIAELLAVDLDPYRQEVVLNAGEAEGVYVGQPLVDAKGIMGQVIRVERHSSTAMLISDPSHALPVQVDRSGLRTLAVGTGDPNLLELRHIPLSSDIEVGDTISTSGLGRRFPADYPVATVTKVERTPGEYFAYVEARPLAELDRSREVLLVWAETHHENSDAAPEETPPSE